MGYLKSRPRYLKGLCLPPGDDAMKTCPYTGAAALSFSIKKSPLPIFLRLPIPAASGVAAKSGQKSILLEHPARRPGKG